MEPAELPRWDVRRDPVFANLIGSRRVRPPPPAGHAAGAEARRRTLHEIAIASRFIAERGKAS